MNSLDDLFNLTIDEYKKTRIMRESEVKKEISLYGLEWDLFCAYMSNKPANLDGMGYNYKMSDVDDFIKRYQPKGMQQLINSNADANELQSQLSKDIVLFTEKGLPIISSLIFFDRITEKHVSIIFYYE